ncbi:response regulator [Paenibacillus filicis]|uniref:Response regulator n=1 Tax=Paenibacillus gyeongsangnamensis TaxID=3388067 RepID=A0ABT4Q8J2_9BACL|nr:helix-turn-helix domain-containing protein [Paenibacillus filicis]MCZ8513192.1 response regulator [Paenibacillus filicis]
MYKALIIDDEAMIRKGLSESVPWSDIGCTLVGVAGNGHEALQAIDQWKPDIVVTDIKMPGYDGMQVAEHAIRANPLAKVILLSGYSEFEYARKGIELGVFHFMLKPTVYEDMKKVIEDAVLHIQSEERQSRELAKFKTEFQQQLHIYRSIFLRKLLLNGQMESGAPVSDELLRLYEIPLDGPLYVILFKPDELDVFFDKEEEKQYWMTVIGANVEQYVGDRESCYFVPLKDEWFSIVYMTKEEERRETITQLCEEIQSLLAAKDLPLMLSFSISRKKPWLSHANQAYLEAVDAIQHVFYMGAGSIIFHADVSHAMDKTEDNVPYSYYTECSKQMIKALQVGNEAECRQKLAELYRSFSKNQERPGVVRAVSVEIAAQVLSLVVRSNIELDFNIREKLFNDILVCETSDGCFNMIEKAVISMSREIYRQIKTQNKKVIEQIIGLLQEYYAQNVSLEWLSGQIHLNSNYISRLIKKETGETFTDLLTNIRIEQAKKLLQNPLFKIYEISSRTGFEDPHYFSVKFKKITGVSPSEYRDYYKELF